MSVDQDQMYISLLREARDRALQKNPHLDMRLNAAMEIVESEAVLLLQHPSIVAIVKSDNAPLGHWTIARGIDFAHHYVCDCPSYRFTPVWVDAKEGGKMRLCKHTLAFHLQCQWIKAAQAVEEEVACRG